MDHIALGRRIRMRRREMKLTQEQLAEKADISPSFLGHIERGSRTLSLGTLLEICKALGTTANDLLGEFGEMPRRQLPDEWPEERRTAVLALLEDARRIVNTMK